MKKVNVIGYLGFNNAGDDLMLLGLLNNYNQIGNIEVRVFVKNINDDLKYQFLLFTNISIKWVKLSKFSILKFIYYSISSASTVWCGGTCFYEDKEDPKRQGMRWINKIVHIAKFFHNKVFFVNVGMNEFVSTDTKHIFRCIISKTDKISFRDDASLSIGKQVILDSNKVYAGGDLAFLSYLEPKLLISEEYFVFCGHADYSGDQYMIDFYAELVIDMSKKLKMKVVFLPLHGGENKNDNSFHYEMLKKISGEIPAVVISEPNISEIIDHIYNSKLVISMRLHALVISEMLSIPNIGLSYNPKVRYFINKSSNLSSIRTYDLLDVIDISDVEYLLCNYDPESNFKFSELNEANNGVFI